MFGSHKSRRGDILLRGAKDLGHDLYIQARIREKRTERVIPAATVMITPRRRISVSLTYVGGAEARNAM